MMDYLALKGKNSDTCYDMNPHSIMLTESSQTQTDRYCLVPLTRGTQNSQTQRRKVTQRLSGAEEEDWGISTKRVEFYLGQ